MAFSFLLLAVVTLAAGAVLVARERAEVVRQRDEARQAVDDMYTEVAEEWLAQQAALQPTQQKFLLKALNYYQRFAGDTSTDATIRLKTAVAYRRVGEIHEKLGDYSKAELACRQSAKTIEGLATDGPFLPQYQSELAISELALVRLLWTTGPQGEAERLTERLTVRLEKLSAEQPTWPQYRDELARCHMAMARFVWRTDLHTCETKLRKAIALFEKLAAESPSNHKYQSSLAQAHSNLGLLLRDLSRHQDARHSYSRAIALNEKLVSESASAPDYVSSLARSLDNLAQLGGLTNDPSEPEKLYRRAIELQEKLMASSPSVPSYRERLAMTYGNLALILGERKKESEQVSRRSTEIFDKLATDFPTSIEYQGFAAMISGLRWPPRVWASARRDGPASARVRFTDPLRGSGVCRWRRGRRGAPPGRRRAPRGPGW